MSEEKEISAAREILNYEREVAAAERRGRLKTAEATAKWTPVSYWMAREERELDEYGIRSETITTLGAYCAQDGPEPWKVMRLFYAVMLHMNIAPFSQLSAYERTSMMSETPQGEHWRTKLFCEAAPVTVDIASYRRKVNSALRGFAERTHHDGQGAYFPLSHMLATDEGTFDEYILRSETIRGIGAYCTLEGPEPWKVIRLFYAVMLHMGIEPFCLLTVRERGAILADSHGMEHWRVKQFCVNPLMRLGAHSQLAPGQKGNTAAAAASEAQKGNNNRRCDHRWITRPGGIRCAKCNQRKKTSTPKFSHV